MEPLILKGSEIAKNLREQIKEEVRTLKEQYGLIPGLLTILVGENPASVSYVTAKQRVAKELGFYSVQENLPEDISEKTLLDLIEKYNQDPSIHGILVQLPLPKHIDEKKVICAINPKKDVDGFHPFNLGRLVMGHPTFIPCTPYGILFLLKEADIEVEGKEVVIIGRSNIVGKPLALLLMQKLKPVGNATVTVCHTATKDLAFHTKRADILIVAAGRPKFISGDMVKEGVVVIDVGVNRIGTTPEGKPILCGDVDFESVKQKASVITPVPGGVGPMTITMLMKNTLEAAKASQGLSEEIQF
ncbi:MAG: Bifunctional protein FolD [Thermodesulfobacterium sp. 37_54]|jgi:methylenetetrahydrofolate dehydrogenase (NADP+)/methenyltetrahydrofolate cyclohydrolase|uniref:Bifunctional protein FolD n=1 Tax=Thermodesulfobacterium commune TaxID=1741 RepID=A0A101FJA1_9BACT|nr:MAG: Bifunctional protein FolD [Thermodesulfobacterium sp. 37_54]KUK19389.1 MAG: Bifunctional protein FolD [Thermodesulfobacterium commune]KUK38042.1 MAG: Bifunctional protein FolD [Thermodesulfobacterium commune]HAA83473.1 bifunctional methylenetetrahydrofolate dehydrogenase/methenyltetrahydrofolate cyclohydrolase FolD [Thermodesulfobacterium commune]HBT04302.1 bifunctional methylenetetrahydrofolate dehydrogenase/methenyltetrahydrofolate cyclohydrolase FolD [Thermodesulfobacterium commune]